MHKTVFSLFRLVPVAFASALIAGTTGCIINANDYLAEGEGEGEDCVVLEETCPSLACEFGNQIVDGCAICECADETVACDDSAAPECENAIQLEDCSWQCGESSCDSDADCDEGFFCALTGSAGAPRNDDPSAEAPVAPPQGVCLPFEAACSSDADCGRGDVCENGICTVAEQDFSCFSDDECFRGEVCLFDGQDPGTDGAADRAQLGICVPAPQQSCTDSEPCAEGFHCEGVNVANALVPLPVGVCVLDDATTCQNDTDCNRGQHCDYNVATNALVAAPGVCVDDTIAAGECESDSDCDGGTCEITCQGDPSCPECDVCFFVGTCVDASCTVDSDCGANQFCDGSNAARPAPQPDCAIDDLNCLPMDPPAGGICRDIPVPACRSDFDCADGQFCDVASTDPALRPAPCDPASGCDTFPVLEGVCRDVVISCFSDDQCAAGEFCDFSTNPSTPNAIVISGGTCQPLPATSCAGDGECAEGEFCDIGGINARRPCFDADGDGQCDTVVIEQGICRPIQGPNGCAVDTDCAAYQVCLFDGCNCAAVCVDDGNDGCLPCECNDVAGICVDVIVDDSCSDDAECGEGRFCNLGGTDADGRRIVLILGVCEDLPIEPTMCFSDAECRQDQVCVFAEPVPGEARPAPSGECKAALTPCATVRCTAETTCEVSADGTAQCVPNAPPR